MGKIAVLDQQTIDKIAAGEVVERPASVAKELVENAIDAGASQVTVEIQEGGIGFLRITDNGSGIEQEDIPLAFLPHSTSKIRSVEDLLEVTSLGFRGEALSSIAAVSMVELISKTRTSVLGNCYQIEGGVEKSFEEIAAPDGTTFIVRNLFYNTPARKKFLKTQTTEAAAIHEMLTHLALSHPEISFKVLINQQIKLQTTGNGKLKDVIYQIYGREVAMYLLDVQFEEGPIKISGLIGKSEVSRGNRNYENYFVNGRFVKSQLIAKAIEDAYRPFLMQHRYPFVCLNLQLDSEYLDVNVHPAKLELRFSNENQIYDWISRAIQESLLENGLIPEVSLESEKQNPFDKAFQKPENQGLLVNSTDKNVEYFRTKPYENNQLLREDNGYQPKVEKKERTNFLAEKKEHKIIGQLFDTYWLVQFKDQLYMIDLYAAYEKVLYEELMKSFHTQAFFSQLLSVPIVLNFSMQEEQQYLNCQAYFAKLGFEIEEFGEGAYMVRAIPANLPQLAQQEILLELVGSLSDISGGVTFEALLEKLASMACKAAVKGKYKISKVEARTVIDKLLTLENPFHCPHGRTIIISMTKYELEKKFKRTI